MVVLCQALEASVWAMRSNDIIDDEERRFAVSLSQSEFSYVIPW